MKTILIVDDSNTARMIARRCLEIVGFEGATFIEAVNGEHAVAFLKRQPVDLVVTDLNMPVMDGETFLKWVKSSPRTHGIPVVMISSADNPAKERHVLELGAHAVLGKPLSPEILRKSVCDLMENTQRWANVAAAGDEKEESE